MPAAGFGVQGMSPSPGGGPHCSLGFFSPSAVLHHREAGPAAPHHHRFLRHGCLLSGHHPLPAAAGRARPLLLGYGAGLGTGPWAPK